jgi:hypothetical protein
MVLPEQSTTLGESREGAAARKSDPTRLSTTAIYRGVAALIWALAVWHCWVARGLFVDGSALLVTMMKNGGYALFFDSRRYVMAVTQAPAATAIELGVTDSQILARLLSAGLFFLPTAFYHAALYRARRDPALLAAVTCAIAIVFLPTSFFIVGEAHTVGAAVLFAGVLLATGTRVTIGDGVLLAATAVLLVRSYETTCFYGLLLAALTTWRVAITGWRGGASLLYGLAVMLFLASAVVAVHSLLHPPSPSQLQDAVQDIVQFWHNLQFLLPLSAMIIVTIAALAAPRLLESWSLYLWAGVLLIMMAVSPLLWSPDGFVFLNAKTHFRSRMVAGMITAAIVLAIWLYTLRPAWMPTAFAALVKPATARRFLAFQLAALLAALPADILLTELWRRSIVEFQSTIGARSGLIPVEETPFGREPLLYLIQDWALPSESLVLRHTSGDGIIVPPQGSTNWQPFDPTSQLPTNMQRFSWGKQNRTQ